MAIVIGNGPGNEFKSWMRLLAFHKSSIILTGQTGFFVLAPDLGEGKLGIQSLLKFLSKKKHYVGQPTAMTFNIIESGES